MDCETLAANLTDFLEGDLSKDSEQSALEHLSSCEVCEIVLAETRNVVDLAHEHGRALLTADARSRLLRNVLEEVDE